MVDRFPNLEKQIRAAAGSLSYPLTPPIAASVMLRLGPRVKTAGPAGRKLAWTLVVLLAFVSALMLVPPVRAAVLEWIQIGIVRILPPPTVNPDSQLQPGIPPLTATPVPAGPTPPGKSAGFSLLDLAGETSLADAQARLDFPVLIPSGSHSMGLPHRVFLQDLGGPMLVLVWLEPLNPERVLLSLHVLTPGGWAIEKAQPTLIQKTAVNGEPGAWVEGPYFLQLRNRDFALVRLIEGHVLIWTQANLTYRLETALPLDEAILIAESLRPIPAGTP